MSGIKDKVVIITGAGSGIGEATALLLAERGAKVVLGARNPDRLQALSARIAASGGEAAYAQTLRRHPWGDASGLSVGPVVLALLWNSGIIWLRDNRAENCAYRHGRVLCVRGAAG
jgi:nucleoside-diphosphate-sugar epimerase